jgi:hypothetical protein
MPDASPRPDRRATTALVVLAFVLLVVAPLVTVAIVSTRLFTPDGAYLEVDMRPTGGTAAQLFWTSTWAFSQEDSSVVPLHQHPGEYERVRFALPSRPIDFIRFDIINGPGEVLIRSMRVVDRQGRTVRVIDPMVMQAMYQIEGIMPVPGTTETRVVTTKDANDPMLLMRGYWMTAAPSWHSPRFVTPFSLAWIAAAALAAIVAGLVAIARDVASGPWTRRDALWFAALFFVVLAARLALLDRYPMPVPFWDQWDGEAWSLYLPFFNGGLTWHQMFTLHNEHRIFFTRVLAMALLQVNGQWDPLLQIVVNIGLSAITAVVLAAIAWIAAGRRSLAAIVLVVALVFAPPFALENTLAGFQSAFYFLILLSLLAVWLMTMHLPGSRAWCLGWLCAFASIFTVAGGLLTVGAIGVFVVLRTLADRDWRRGALDAALAMVAAVGYAALSPPIAYHAYLKAESLHSFAAALARNVAFPWIRQPRASIFVWIPLAVLAAAVLRRRLRSTRLEQLAIVIGVWVLAQSAALAYSRGVGGTAPASRYLDMLAFGFVANSLALLALVQSRDGGRTTRPAVVATVAWLVAGAIGIGHVSQAVLAKDARDRRGWMQEYVRNVRAFVSTGDLPALAAKRGPMEIPYYSPQMLGGWLGHPYIRQILPAVIREPIALQAAPGSASGFTQTTSPKDLIPVWDSYGSARARTTGTFESAPVSCGAYRYLRFEVAGNLRDSSMRLTLKDTVTGAETAVRPPLGAGSGWIGTSVRCPDHPFVVTAADESATSWFAFRQPAGTAWPSTLAERAIQQWRIVAIVAAVLVVLAAVPPRRREAVS